MMVDFSKAHPRSSVIIKQEIPLLEYDDTSLGLFQRITNGPQASHEKCLFAFLGDVVHDYAVEHGQE